jgi:lipid-A-disaccharide synthase
MLVIADYIFSLRPSIRFIVPVAPTVEIETLRKFADAEFNPIININGWGRAQLLQPDAANPYFQTEQGLKIELIPPSSAQEVLAQSHLAITTVGANTAELAALNTPMIVLLPTQQLDTMRSWDGLPGILANLPGVGSLLAKGINWVVLQQKNRLYAWPNIWAKTEIVPELLGKLEAESVGKIALDWLAHPEKLQEISDRLQGVCGQPGAAQKIAHLVGVMLE